MTRTQTNIEDRIEYFKNLDEGKYKDIIDFHKKMLLHWNQLKTLSETEGIYVTPKTHQCINLLSSSAK